MPAPTPPTTLPTIGPYRVTRYLEPSRHGLRALCLHTGHNSSHLLHEPRLTVGREKGGEGKFAAAMGKLAALDHAHLLAVDERGWDPAEGPWVITDYTGDTDGIVTLDRLLRAKGGWLTLEEARRALEQVLSATAHAHQQGLAHGTLEMDEVHVDRRGSLLVEFYGLRKALKGGGGDADQHEEVRSIVRMGYQLVTGLVVREPLIPVGHVVADIDRTWKDFFETGMGRPGFSSAAHALSAARACRIAAGGAVNSARAVVRAALGRK